MIRRAGQINLADLYRALPSRPIDKRIAQTKNSMFTVGKNPLPIAAPQSKPGVYCPSCGHAHKLGAICENNNKIAALIVEGDRVEKGNPCHDKGGKFSSDKDCNKRVGSTPHRGRFSKPESAPAPAMPPASAITSPSAGPPTESSSTPTPTPEKTQQQKVRNGKTGPDPYAATQQSPSAFPQLNLPGPRAESEGVAAYEQAHKDALASGMNPKAAHAAGQQAGIAAFDKVVAAHKQRSTGKTGLDLNPTLHDAPSMPESPTNASTPTIQGRRPSPSDTAVESAVPTMQDIGAPTTHDASSPTAGARSRSKPGEDQFGYVPSNEAYHAARGHALGLGANEKEAHGHGLKMGRKKLAEDLKPPKEVKLPKEGKPPKEKDPARYSQPEGSISSPSLYGTGSAIGSGAFTPGASVQPAVGLVRQGAHSLLNPFAAGASAPAPPPVKENPLHGNKMSHLSGISRYTSQNKNMPKNL